MKKETLYAAIITGVCAEAISAYDAALVVKTKETFPLAWCQLKSHSGYVLRMLARLQGTDGGGVSFARATVDIQDVLGVLKPDQSPQEWAMEQINLGSCLLEQTALTPKDKWAELFAPAIIAFRKALTIFTEKDFHDMNQMTTKLLDEALSMQKQNRQSQ